MAIHCACHVHPGSGGEAAYIAASVYVNFNHRGRGRKEWRSGRSEETWACYVVGHSSWVKAVMWYHHIGYTVGDIPANFPNASAKLPSKIKRGRMCACVCMCGGFPSSHQGRHIARESSSLIADNGSSPRESRTLRLLTSKAGNSSSSCAGGVVAAASWSPEIVRTLMGS